MTIELNDHIRNWLKKAEEDIAVILYLSAENPQDFTSALCFHSQQAVEKFLKAFLIYKGVEFGRTHDVDFLLTECIAQDNTGFEDLEFGNLNDYAVSVRYPDDFFIPSIEEAMQNVKIALSVKVVVSSKIQISNDLD